MKKAPQVMSGIPFAALLTLAGSVSAAPTFWSGAAGDTLWSSGGNWSPAGAPGITANVIFTNDAVALDAFTVNNIVDLDFSAPSINALGYMNTNGFHYTQVTGELRVLSSSTAEVATTADDGNPYVFFVGGNQWQDDKDAIVYTTITGNSLIVSNGNANFGVTQIGAVSGAHRATLNLSELNTFVCVVSNVLVGHNFTQPDHAWRPTGEFYLARSNSITARNVIVADVYQNAGAACYIHLGAINTINANEIRIGMHKTVGFIDIAPGVLNPSVTFRNAAGTGRQLAWKLGDEFDPDGTNYLFGFFTSNQARGTADLTGASVDALVDRVVLGRGQIQVDPTNRTGDGNGTLIFGGGVIDVNDIEMGIQVPGPFIGGSVGHGILTVNNDFGVGPALLIVRSNIVMAVQQAGAPAPDAIGSTGDITVNDGSSIAVAGDITSGGPGGGTATITLNNGGTLDMQPAGDATPGNVSINILNIADGIITNYATLSVTNINLLLGSTVFTVYPGQTIAPAGINKIGPLSVSGSLSLLGTTLMDIDKNGATLSSDAITATAPVELGGTLKVSLPGAHTDLVPGDKFTLFAAVPGGTSLTLVLPPPGAGLAWVNNIFFDGSIEVIPCGCGEPTTPPALTVTASPASATVSWPLSYVSFVLRSQTNVLGTNWTLVPGVMNNSFTIPFQPGNTSVYFHLIQQNQ
ncbi:MAG: hypothetical protein L0Y58_13030 [Verrucomicrobia subdivision 3 bacterium]|nr:hypothetical protein [Limisphaerales bacterium]